MTATDSAGPGFGANSWLVEEMYEQFRSDPGSVSEAWQEFFSDYKPTIAHVVQAPAVAPVAASPNGSAAPVVGPSPDATVAEELGDPIRGAGAAIAANMERSLSVPTATGFRDVPAKLLEVNRKVINGYRSRSGQGKVSFTHLIGFAVVRAIADAVPNMGNSYVAGTDGKPRVLRNPTVNMGLAVDVDKGDGTRTLVVPVLRNADTLDFAGFLAAYEDLIRKVKTNKLAVSDFQGATITLTNPGTIGTVQSVPRLMPGQGVIVGVGTIDYPAAFQGADERTIGSLGVSKIVTITSTYDHRIIQGAESGLFLKRVHELLLGEHGYYEDVFKSLGVPYEAVKWRVDHSPIDSEDAMLRKQMQVATLIRVHRVRGHLIADLDPLRWKEPDLPVEIDPATYGLTIWDLDREFLTGGVGGHEKLKLGDLLGVLRDAYCRTIGIEYMHIQDFSEQRWIQSKVEGVQPKVTKERKQGIVERLNAAEAFEKFLSTKYVGTKRFGLEGAESAIPILDQVLSMAADAGLDSAAIGMAHRGRLSVLANVIGKSYDQIFKEFEGHIDPSSVQGPGDVKYHLGATGKYESPSGADIRVELAANPSHLETVDPIVLGMMRAV
ncbi:MAG: 2-oxo acid dehydrogenase subunit E2, partial [Ilumatobacteraceae bacterium]